MKNFVRHDVSLSYINPKTKYLFHPKELVTPDFIKNSTPPVKEVLEWIAGYK